MVVGKVEQIHIEENALTEEGYINLEKTNSAGILVRFLILIQHN